MTYLKISALAVSKQCAGRLRLLYWYALRGESRPSRGVILDAKANGGGV